MKRTNVIYAVLWTCICLSACAEQEDVSIIQNIGLRAVVEDVKLASRSSYATPVSDDSLKAAIWFALESGKYPEELPEGSSSELVTLSEETNIPLHTEIIFHNGEVSYPEVSNVDKPRYPTREEYWETDVYCVGFHPCEGWSTTGANVSVATHAITGDQDLMFAPQIAGQLNRHFGTQRFRHLLTWLKVCVCATTAEAGDYWGKLKKVTLKEVPTSLQVDLTKAEGDDFSLSNTVTPSSETQSIEMLNDADSIDLGITIRDVASVFCYPKSKYKLFIECENGKSQDIEIDLHSLSTSNQALLSYPAGLQYVLILNFHPFNVVEGVCTLKEWNAQNEDLYPTASTN